MNSMSFTQVQELIELLGGQEGALKALENLQRQKFGLESILRRTILIRADKLDEYNPIGYIGGSLKRWPHLVPKTWWGHRILFLGEHDFDERKGKFYHCRVIDEKGELLWEELWDYETAKEKAKTEPDVLIPVVEK